LVEIRKKYSFKDMKHILDANGIINVEVEWLLDWYCNRLRAKPRRMKSRAAAGGSRSIARAAYQDCRSRQ